MKEWQLLATFPYSSTLLYQLVAMFPWNHVHISPMRLPKDLLELGIHSRRQTLMREQPMLFKVTKSFLKLESLPNYISFYVWSLKPIRKLQNQFLGSPKHSEISQNRVSIARAGLISSDFQRSQNQKIARTIVNPSQTGFTETF